MKKTLSILVVLVILFYSISCVNLALAVQTGTGQTSSTISNPLTSNSLQDLIAQALQFVVNLLAIAGIVYIVLTGFKFVSAQGKPEKLTEAKTAFIHALIGMAIILGAWAIAQVISKTISGVTQNNVTLGTPGTK